MATQAQIDANRANAQKSCGPKTNEGKARSCMNHLSHGFTSANIFIILEEQEEFNALLSDLIAQFQPATPNEQILVEKMVQNHWITLRAIRLQSVVLKATVHNGSIHKDLGVLIRYQTAADRAYHKAHAELVKAQKEREKSGIGFESKNAVEPAETHPEPPENPPAAPEEPQKAAPEAVILPDFTPFEDQLEALMGISLDDLKGALKEAA